MRDGYAETLAYCDMPREHWQRIRTNSAIERLNRKPSPMPVVARLKYVADSEWGFRRHLTATLLKK